MAGYVADAAPKQDSSCCPELAHIPSPLRVSPPSSPEAQPVCVLDICPWDSLAQFLTLPELSWVCCVSAPLHAQLTIEEENTVDGNKVRSRKLLAPLIVLKMCESGETAEAELQRVSLGNIRNIRVWNHRSLDILCDAVASVGGPQVLRSLERVALKGCPLTEDCISSFIYPAFSCTQLKHLNLEKNLVTDDNLIDLVKSGALDAGSLESMNLRFNRIGSRGVEALAASPCCAALKWVNLKMNQVGDDGAIALAEMLNTNTTMSLLNLRRQTPPLTDKAAFAFADMLKNNCALEQLRLRQNKITDSGAMSLAGEVVGHVQKLQYFLGVGARFELDLEQNRIKETGATSLLESLTGVSRAVKVEILIHGNPVKREAILKDDVEASTINKNARLAFESKAEGLLW